MTVSAEKKGISMSQLMSWNKAIDKDCNGLWAEYYICTKIKGVQPTTTTSGTPNAPTAPAATQPGIVKDCHDWYVAQKGDSCTTIVAHYGNINTELFVKYNPAVGSDCAGLWAQYAYCVGRFILSPWLCIPPVAEMLHDTRAMMANHISLNRNE